MQPFDCEALGGSFPRQVVNTWSSLAFLVAAVVLWRRGRRVAAVAAALAGVGSVLFHGAPSEVSSWAHDVGLYLAVAVATVEVWKRVVERRPPWLAAGVFSLGVAIWATSRTGGSLCRPESLMQGHAVWHVLAALAFALTFTVRRNTANGAPATEGHDSRFGGTGSGAHSGSGA